MNDLSINRNILGFEDSYKFAIYNNILVLKTDYSTYASTYANVLLNNLSFDKYIENENYYPTIKPKKQKGFCKFVYHKLSTRYEPRKSRRREEEEQYQEEEKYTIYWDNTNYKCEMCSSKESKKGNKDYEKFPYCGECSETISEYLDFISFYNRNLDNYFMKIIYCREIDRKSSIILDTTIEINGYQLDLGNQLVEKETREYYKRI